MTNPGPRRCYVEGPFGQIHLHIAGAGGTPLLLLHQSPLNGAMFAAAMPFLASAGFHAVAMDTPGYGLSDPVPGKPSIADYASAVPAALQQLGWASAHLLGHHTGALIAGHLAACRPELVKRLVLNGVPLLTAEEKAFFDSLGIAAMTIEADGSHLLAAWNRRMEASPGWTDLAAMHRYTVDMLALPETYHLAFEAAFAHELKADLAAIRAPTLILTNTGEDLYEPSRRAHALRPDFAFAALEGGTHDIVDEQPEAWSKAVANFLHGEAK